MSGGGTVVIYRLGSLGDTVVALPCFHAIQRAFPDHRRIVLTNVPVSSKAAPLGVILGDGGFIDDTIAYPVGIRRPSEFLKLRGQLRALGAETLIYMMGGRGLARVRRDLVFFRLCGFKQIIGAPKSHDDDRGRTVAGGQDEPEAERLARALGRLGPIDLMDPQAWDLRLTAKEHEAATALLQPLGGKPFIVVNMGGKATEKDWGEPNWATLFQQLRRHTPGWGMVIVGAPDDAPRAGRLAPLWHGPSIDACGRLTPRESAAVMRSARVFVGHDSGPLHLAAAAQIPAVGIFGGYNRPRKWHPYGDRNVVVHEMGGVDQIPVDRIEQAVCEALQFGRTPAASAAR